MGKKRFIGQFVKVKLIGKKTPLNGVVIDYNDEWTLMKFSPGDYEMNGFVLFKQDHIEATWRSEEEKFREKIIKLKGTMPVAKDKIPLDDLETILTYLNDKHKMFSIELKSEKAIYLGRLKSIDEKKIIVESLDTKGKWDGVDKFKPDSIYIISFDNDYINSLKLIAIKR